MSDKKQITFDFNVRSSPGILFGFLTTTEGLAQWFADHVDSFDKEYIFSWDGSEEKATMLESIEDEMVRYRMEDSEEEEYLEFKIEKAEISNDTILYITEIIEEDDIEDQRIFWDAQIDLLRNSIGAGN